MINTINKVSMVVYSKLAGLCYDSTPPTSDCSREGKHATLLRVSLCDPWKDYEAVTPITEKGSFLTYRNDTYFVKATIEVYEGENTGIFLKALCDIQHSAISKIFDVYSYESKIFIASEYLELSLIDLEFHSFQFDEWEIATIIKEILKACEYLLRQGVSCKDISIFNIRLSINGEVKIALNFNHYIYQRKEENLNLLHAFLDLPVLAEIAEDMMLPRFHIVGANNAWSSDALQFLSYCLSGSVESILKHSFLRQATSPSKLAPRVRFALDVLRLQGTRTIVNE